MLHLYPSILKAKQETNQSSSSVDTSSTSQSSKKRRGKHRRKSEKKNSSIKNLSPKEYLSIPSSTINPIVISNRTKVHDTEQLNLFFSEIEFTHDGINSFFNHSFNRSDYGTTFLPHNFCHLEQFITYAYKTGQSPEFIEGVLRLFNQKIKMTPYISAPALEEMLQTTKPYFVNLLAQQEGSFLQLIKDQLISVFKTQFSFLQDNPLGFFDHLSEQLASTVSSTVTSPDRIRFTFLRLLTSCYDRLIWSPADQEKTWESFKILGEIITYLHEKNVIPDELDANDLYWSLIERYIYFLDLIGSKLTLNTCQTIKHDLQTNSISWLNTPEQEEGLQTKMERLVEALLDTQIKIQAQQQSLLMGDFHS